MKSVWLVLLFTLMQACDTAMSADVMPKVGNFSPEFSGFSSPPPNAVVYWSKSGNLVTIRLVFSVGTSNAKDFTITNLPEDLRPSYPQVMLLPSSVDAGQDVPNTTVYVSDVLAFGKGSTHATGGGWTESGFKGLGSNAGYSFTYSIQ